MNNPKKTILIFTAGYLPGSMGGGPIRSIAAIVSLLSDEFAFKIITLDRDLGSSESYKGIIVNEWQHLDNAEVFYISPESISFSYIRKILNSTDYDVLYLNSFFSPKFTIIPIVLLRLGLIRTTSTIVAPRGEFSSGALNLKPYKKKVYIFLIRTLNLYKNVILQASSPFEQNDIIRTLGLLKTKVARFPIKIAPDLFINNNNNNNNNNKTPGSLSILFLSRISPKKNLDGALLMLSKLKGNVTFNIYGPLEDKRYWDMCQQIASGLPSNVHVSYKGTVDHNEVSNIMNKHDIFFFPTHGENFGHVILEALLASCPILISDQTPWRDLESKGIGWDLPLDSPVKFTDVLQKCVNMDKTEYLQIKKNVFTYSRQMATDTTALKENLELFNMI